MKILRRPWRRILLWLILTFCCASLFSRRTLLASDGEVNTVGLVPHLAHILQPFFLLDAHVPVKSTAASAVTGQLCTAPVASDTVSCVELSRTVPISVSSQQQLRIISVTVPLGNMLKITRNLVYGPGYHRLYAQPEIDSSASLYLTPLDLSVQSDSAVEMCYNQDSCFWFHAGFYEISRHLAGINFTIPRETFLLNCDTATCQSETSIVYGFGLHYVAKKLLSFFRVIRYDDALYCMDSNNLFINVQDFLTQPEKELHYKQRRVEYGLPYMMESRVTLVTQLSVNRLQRLQLITERWTLSPISVALYLSSPLDILVLLYYLSKRGLKFSNIGLVVIKPAYHLESSRYFPINALRNHALALADTKYVLMVEADFLPSRDMDEYLYEQITPMLARSTRPTAFVVPCLGLRATYSGSVPRWWDELLAIGWGYVYVTDYRTGHGVTKTNVFMTPPLFRPAEEKTKDENDQRTIMTKDWYEVCFESQWEPYYVLEKSVAVSKILPRYVTAYRKWLEHSRTSNAFKKDFIISPEDMDADISDSKEIVIWYDSRLANQGGDKQAHAIMLNVLGFQFFVIRSRHFLLHMDHDVGMEGWPGGFKAQTKDKLMGYFVDFLAEIEDFFGRWYRWPRGCTFPLISDMQYPVLQVSGGF